MSSMPAAPQNLRVLPGRFVLTRVTDVRTVAFEADLLALVLGPDGCHDAARRQGRGRVGGTLERR